MPSESHGSSVAPVAHASGSLVFAEDPAGVYTHIRDATEALTTTLEIEDFGLQSMEDCSPAKWHLAHTTWFFETFVLARGIADYRPFHDGFAYLFNSYYESVGRMHPRPLRGLLSRPTVNEVRLYRQHVDARMAEILRAGSLDQAALDIVELGLHHEQQHQELLLTDIKHAFWCNPLRPAYREGADRSPREAPTIRWVDHPGGVARVGHRTDAFSFDNEGPAHRVFLEPFGLQSRLVTCGEYREFMADRGYERPELWLSAGWQAVQTHGWRAPLYWSQRDGHWDMFTLDGTRALDDHEPVTHVSYYEADAYARWTGYRLPTEFEWEVSCGDRPVAGNFVEGGALHPRVAGAKADGLAQMFGDVWEWTMSAYAPYPAYRAPAGALGEYNGKFMCSQLVLRGGSCVSPASHLRSTYRNFFYPDARWQFSGIRLARDT